MMRNHNILPYTEDARKLAVQLRNNMTLTEIKFWNATKKSKLDVIMRRQMPILDYVVDFYVKDLGIAIEIDGDVHKHHILEDGIRQSRIEKLGVKFIRFTNDEVNKDITKVITKLKSFIDELKNE